MSFPPQLRSFEELLGDRNGDLKALEGVDPKLLWGSTEFLKANNVSAWSDMPVWIPGQGKTSGFHRRDFSRATAEGLTYRPLPLTAADTLGWFRTLPAERQGKLRAGLKSEREAELLTKLKA